MTPSAILAAQREAFGRAGPPAQAARESALLRLDRAVRQAAPRLAEAVAQDFGQRSPLETMAAEILPVRAACRHARQHVGRWMRPRPRAVGLAFKPATNWVEVRPLGTVGIVAPWNYPIFLTLGPLVDAIAAGNRAMIKPSEMVPRTGAVLREMLAGLFLDEEVAVVEGDADVARAFCALPFDHLLFTGSTAVGHQVMAAAAEHLVPVTLELGGKSPVILAADAKVEAAARSVMLGKLFNAGQTCIAPDYVLAPRERVREFGEAAIAAAERFFPVLAGNPDMTSIISERHAERLRRLRDGAGGTVLRHSALDAGRVLSPAVVLDPPAEDPLMQEEIFGPILPVIGVDTLEAAIGFVNARPRPLALYAYSQDPVSIRAVLDRTVSGGVTLNSTLMHCAQPDLPFGGIGASGMGAYHGEEGFLRFSHLRGIHRRGPFSGFEFMTPPHGKAARLMLRALGGG